ncbi:MAG: DNA polymerase III subunit beta [Syntrophobacteraceae bacterium]
MKVQVEKAALTQVLQKVQTITEKKTNIPILFNVLIKTSNQDQLLEFSATDLELSIWTHTAALVAEPGSTTVSARKLHDIVREIPQDYIMLETLPNSKLLVQAGRSRFELSTIPAEDFPNIAFYEDANLLPCDAAMLRRCFNKTLYGIPVEEDPFSISGLFWHPIESEQLRFVSSDGHRLAYVQIDGNSFKNLEIGNGIVIPRKGVQEMLKVVEKESEVSIGTFENCLILKTQDTYLSIQLLEAEFPEYQLIIPEERPNFFSIDWEVFYHSLKRVAVLTNQKWRHVRFIITEGTLMLESGDPELGSATDALDIEYGGDDFTIAFNIRYVLEAVQAMESPEVRFEWVDEFHGGVFLGSDDPEYLGLIMPMVV